MKKIAIIDDNEEYLKSILRYLERNINCNILPFSSVKDAFVYLLNDNETDVVVTDYKMPGWDGKNVIDVMVNYSPHVRIVVNTAYKKDFYDDFYNENKDKYRQITHIVEKGDNNDLVFSIEKAIEISLDAKDVQEYDIMGLIYVATAQDERYPHLKWHSRNVTCYSLHLAKAIGLPKNMMRSIYKAGLLHDIGKIAILDEIIMKNDKLTQEEKKIIMQHPEKGVNILQNHKDKIMKDIIKHHHESFDGSGYPDQLRGLEIPIGARILAIADTYDAQTTERPYRKAKSPQEALEEMKKVKNKQLDTEIVDIFIEKRLFETRTDLDVPLDEFIIKCEAIIKKENGKPDA